MKLYKIIFAFLTAFVLLAVCACGAVDDPEPKTMVLKSAGNAMEIAPGETLQFDVYEDSQKLSGAEFSVVSGPASINSGSGLLTCSASAEDGAVIKVRAVLTGYECDDFSLTVEIPEETGPVSTLFGIGEPLAPFTASAVNKCTTDRAIDLMRAMGVKSYRTWIDISIFENYSANMPLAETGSISFGTVAACNQVLIKMKKAGIAEIIGHGLLFPRVTSTVKGTSTDALRMVPRRNDPDYGEFLLKIEKFYYSLSSNFPLITVWEVGNENNSPDFMKPPSGADFTEDESAAIVTDILYYATRGVKAGNPNAITINPGWSPYYNQATGLVNVKNYHAKLYTNINSGNFPSAGGAEKSINSRDYFQGAAWHPYYYFASNDRAPDATWKAQNDAIYQLMVDNGDGDLPVFFTEVGFTSGAGGAYNPTLEETQAGFYQAMFDLVAEMPYVKTVNTFRLFECGADASWGGQGEVKYGLFREPVNGESGFVPNPKGLALQQVYGGIGNLNMYAGILE